MVFPLRLESLFIGVKFSNIRSRARACLFHMPKSEVVGINRCYRGSIV